MQSNLEENISVFKLKNEEYVVIPKTKYFQLKSAYPIYYKEVENQGELETIDFGPNGLKAEDFISHLKS